MGGGAAAAAIGSVSGSAVFAAAFGAAVREAHAVVGRRDKGHGHRLQSPVQRVPETKRLGMHWVAKSQLAWILCGFFDTVRMLCNRDLCLLHNLCHIGAGGD